MQIFLHIDFISTQRMNYLSIAGAFEIDYSSHFLFCELGDPIFFQPM